MEQLNIVYQVDFPPNLYWFNTLSITSLWTAGLCSTLFILNMTFDRFYSIIRPHKAASFNTVKRAKISIAYIVIFSILFNIPHLFTTTYEGRQSVPFGKGMQYLQGQLYYWLSLCVNYALPFILLLIMNSVIIHTLRRRSSLQIKHESVLKESGRNDKHQQQTKLKSSETQIFAILLLVTFGFLLLTTPAYAFFLYVRFVNYHVSPQKFAEFYLFYNFAHKLFYTNYGINFFLYVISGRKFRSDLVKLFSKDYGKQGDTSQDGNTRSSTIEVNTAAP